MTIPFHFIRNPHSEYTLYNTLCNPCFIQNYHFDRKVSKLEKKYYLTSLTFHFTIGISLKIKLEIIFIRTIFIAGNEFEKSKSPIFDVDFYMSELKKRKKRMCHYHSTRWSSLIAPRRFGFVSGRDSDNTIVLLMVTRLSARSLRGWESSFFLSGYFFLLESLILSTPYSIEPVTPVS
jgi:hypothetical protein